MNRFLLATLAITLALVAFTPDVAADPTGCFGPDQHQGPDCRPDTSDPTCIYWFFGIGEARVCADDYLP